MSLKLALSVTAMVVINILSGCSPSSSVAGSVDPPPAMGTPVPNVNNTDPKKGWVYIQDPHNYGRRMGPESQVIAKKCDGTTLMYASAASGENGRGGVGLSLIEASPECQ